MSWATCCSQWPTSPATARSTPKPPCAPRMTSSSAVSAMSRSASPPRAASPPRRRSRRWKRSGRKPRRRPKKNAASGERLEQRQLDGFQDRPHLGHHLRRRRRDDSRIDPVSRPEARTIEAQGLSARLFHHQRAGSVVPRLGHAVEGEIGLAGQDLDVFAARAIHRRKLAQPTALYGRQLALEFLADTIADHAVG